MSVALSQDRWALYGAGMVCDVCGITYRQLSWWIEMGLVLPSMKGDGKGHPTRFDNDDIEWIQVVAQLVELGVNPHRILEAVREGRAGYVQQMQTALQRLREVVPLTA